MQNLRRIHDAYGHLSAIWSNLQTFQRASSFNPRDGDSWDLFGLRDEQMTQINRILRRAQRTTRQLERATGYAPNRSREMSRLFGDWAQSYADNGPDARETQRAQTAFLTLQYQWADAWETEHDRVDTAIRAMRRQKDFYDAQHRLFNDLKRLATAVVRYGVSTAHQAQALAYMVQFEEAANLSRNIAGHYGAGLSNAARWQNDLREAKRELDAWLGWSRNRRQVDRSLQSQRAPR